MRDFVQGDQALGYLFSLLGFAALECIEVWVARKLNMGKTVSFGLSQLLTIMLFVSNQINTTLVVNDAKIVRLALIEFEVDTITNLSEMLTWAIFIATPLFIAVTVTLYKWFKRKRNALTPEQVSI